MRLLSILLDEWPSTPIRHKEPKGYIYLWGYYSARKRRFLLIRNRVKVTWDFKLFFAFVQGHIIQCKLQNRERHRGENMVCVLCKRRREVAREKKEKNKQIKRQIIHAQGCV